MKAPAAPRLRLQEVRQRQGLSVRELAERSGIPVSDLYQYEEGSRTPQWPRLLRLAKALGVRLEELLP